MSADMMRQAAALMRERAAEAEQPGYDSDQPGQPWCPDWTWTAVRHVARNMDIECDKHGDDLDCNTWGRYAGYHIAGMTPFVALAVADWLDACALVVTAAPDATKAHAERVARAYLGEPS